MAATGLPQLAYFGPEYMRAAARSTAISKIKERGAELMRLQPGQTSLDIGCGPGIDTVRRARIVGPEGRVVGLDSDPRMIAEANREATRVGVSGWTFHQVASSTRLPFSADSFDSCYSERLFQHLPPPAAELTLTESLRVTKPGGWVVVIDTDWATFSVDVDPTETEIERRLMACHARRFANPYAGRQLYRMFRQHRFADISSDLFNISLDAASVDVLLNPTEQWALAVGDITQYDWVRWRNELRLRAAYGTFFAHLSMVAVAGKKPGQSNTPRQ